MALEAITYTPTQHPQIFEGDDGYDYLVANTVRGLGRAAEAADHNENLKAEGWEAVEAVIHKVRLQDPAEEFERKCPGPVVCTLWRRKRR